MAVNLDKISMFEMMEESVKLKLEVGKVKEQFLTMLQSGQSFTQPTEQCLSSARDQINHLYVQRSSNLHKKHMQKRLQKRLVENKENTPPRLKNAKERLTDNKTSSDLYLHNSKIVNDSDNSTNEISLFSTSVSRVPLHGLYHDLSIAPGEFRNSTFIPKNESGHETRPSHNKLHNKSRIPFCELNPYSPKASFDDIHSDFFSTKVRHSDCKLIENSLFVKKSFTSTNNHEQNDNCHLSALPIKLQYEKNKIHLKSNEISCNNLSSLSAFPQHSLVHEHRSSSNINDVFHSTMNYPLHSTICNIEDVSLCFNEKEPKKKSPDCIQMETNPNYEPIDRLKALSSCKYNMKSNIESNNDTLPKLKRKRERTSERHQQRYSHSQPEYISAKRIKTNKIRKRNEEIVCQALDICQYESFYNGLMDKSSLLLKKKVKVKNSKKNMSRELGISNLHDSLKGDCNDIQKVQNTEHKRRSSLYSSSSKRRSSASHKADISNFNSIMVKKCSKLTSDNLTKLLCW